MFSQNNNNNNNTKNFLHEFDWNNVKIIDYESNYKKRIISEMIHIKCNTHRKQKRRCEIS